MQLSPSFTRYEIGQGGVMTISTTVAEQYLAKAAEAEAIASRFAESFQRTSWLEIAQGYRELAASLATTEPSAKQPSP